MSNLFKRVLAATVFICLISCNAPGDNENSVVTIQTTMGNVRVRLYDDTPIHRDNFIKLVRSGFYEGISFHRVINEFMIQAGDPRTRTVREGLADSLSTYTIPAEFRPQHFHKKGALAAARQGNDVNPEMRSSGTQFYIVQGKPLTEPEISEIEKNTNRDQELSTFRTMYKNVADSAARSGNPLTSDQVQQIASIKMFDYLNSRPDFKVAADHREVYKTLGGVPRLDGTYTVFGEVIEGLDVVDKIAAVQTGQGDRPVNDVKILKMKVEKE